MDSHTEKLDKIYAKKHALDTAMQVVDDQKRSGRSLRGTRWALVFAPSGPAGGTCTCRCSQLPVELDQLERELRAADPAFTSERICGLLSTPGAMKRVAVFASFGKGVLPGGTPLVVLLTLCPAEAI